MIMSLKQNNRKFKPGIKLNHNISNIVVKNKQKVSKMLKEFRCEFITRRSITFIECFFCKCANRIASR